MENKKQPTVTPNLVEPLVMTHFYSWRNNEKRLTLYKRHCRIIGRFRKMNSMLIEFENGQQEVVSRNSVRKLPKFYPDGFGGMNGGVYVP